MLGIKEMSDQCRLDYSFKRPSKYCCIMYTPIVSHTGSRSRFVARDDNGLLPLTREVAGRKKDSIKLKNKYGDVGTTMLNDARGQAIGSREAGVFYSFD